MRLLFTVYIYLHKYTIIYIYVDPGPTPCVPAAALLRDEQRLPGDINAAAQEPEQTGYTHRVTVVIIVVGCCSGRYCLLLFIFDLV